MDGIRPPPPNLASEYHPMRNCDSDDSQSSGSRSEEADALPSIVYTSDDSADVGQSDSTYVDSDLANYIAQDVEHKMEDELSQQLLLDAELALNDQPSPQVDTPFISHPLSSVNLNMASQKDMNQNLSPIFSDMSKVHLQVNPGEGLGLTRSNSTSSSSTEAEFSNDTPFLSQYEPLPLYPEDENFEGGLNFTVLKEDPVKSKVIQDQLNSLGTNKDVAPSFKTHGNRFYVGDVPIDARYRSAFYVKWNWPRIRQTCVFMNLAMLFGFLCAGIGLIIQMPKGSDCNPVQEWWQGTTTYYIFVPSFQDTDGNGFGDLSGVIKRLDYLEGLGVKSIRLSPIYPSESFVDDYVLPNNYTDVAPILGDARDLHLLSALLHEREMFLILDMPLIQPGGGVGQGNKAGVDLEFELPSILSFWMKYGVDGFAFTDLHKLGDLNDLVPGIHAWRNVLDAQTLGLHRRVMMVPLKLMKRLEHEASAVLPRVQKVFNLIDVVLETSQTAEEIAAVIDDATRWDDHPSLPWINWRIGGPFEPRINDKASGTTSLSTIPALGLSLLQLFLPGSVTLYYGDEIGLYLNEPDKLDFSWAVPMAWSPDGDGGFSKGEPWLSMGGDWERRNVVSMNDSLATLRTMIEARTEKVPLYINGIFEDVGTFHPKKSTNYKIRFASGELLIIDRYYPRRHKFALVINLGPHTFEKDLSKLYFGGQVLVSSYDKEGYVRFKNITLRPREAMVLLLDK